MDETHKDKKIKKTRVLAYTLLIVGFLCLILSGLIGFRVFQRVEHRPRPLFRQTNVSLIQDWMTLSYISRTYGVPEPELSKQLNIDPVKFRRSSLSQIAKSNNLQLPIFLEQVKKVIVDFQIAHQTPPPN